MQILSLTSCSLSRHRPTTAPPLPGNFTAEPNCKTKKSLHEYTYYIYRHTVLKVQHYSFIFFIQHFWHCYYFYFCFLLKLILYCTYISEEGNKKVVRRQSPPSIIWAQSSWTLCDEGVGPVCDITNGPLFKIMFQQMLVKGGMIKEVKRLGKWIFHLGIVWKKKKKSTACQSCIPSSPAGPSWDSQGRGNHQCRQSCGKTGCY